MRAAACRPRPHPFRPGAQPRLRRYSPPVLIAVVGVAPLLRRHRCLLGRFEIFRGTQAHLQGRPEIAQPERARARTSRPVAEKNAIDQRTGRRPAARPHYRRRESNACRRCRKSSLPTSEPRTMMNPGGTGVAFGASGATSLGGGGGGNGTAINFFGIRDISTSVVIMIDVSDSMFTRTGDASGRTLVRHGQRSEFPGHPGRSDQARAKPDPADAFWDRALVRRRLLLETGVGARDRGKQAGRDRAHPERSRLQDGQAQPAKPGGTRHDYALEEAFSLKPETIYMLTDGNATAAQPGGGLKPIPPQEIYRVAEEGQKAADEKGASPRHLLFEQQGKIRRGRYAARVGQPEQRQIPKGRSERPARSRAARSLPNESSSRLCLTTDCTDGTDGKPKRAVHRTLPCPHPCHPCNPWSILARLALRLDRTSLMRKVNLNEIAGGRTQIAQRQIPQVRQRHLDRARPRKGFARPRTNVIPSISRSSAFRKARATVPITATAPRRSFIWLFPGREKCATMAGSPR